MLPSRTAIMNEILDFISEFSSVRGSIKLFTQGECYWFARILDIRFGKSDIGSKYKTEIYYNDIEDHFICKIENNFYDIRGLLKSEMVKGYESWEKYQKKDPLHAAHIITCDALHNYKYEGED